MTSRPELAVVTVPFKVKELLRGCLSSVYASMGVEDPLVWVVDAASGDGTAEAVATEFPRARVIASPENPGFGRANNLALREILALDIPPRYVLLLNPDTVLPPGALRQMLDLMDELPGIGAAGPRLHLDDGTIDWACRRGFPTPASAFYHMVGLSRLFPRSRRFGRYRLTFLDERALADVDSLVGAFMLIRFEALKEIGLFDESFFMYGEDLDLSFRLKRAGWRVVYNGRVDVLHYKRRSTSQNPAVRLEFWRAMLVFFQKHYASTTALPLRLLVEGALRARLALLRAGIA